MRLQVIVHRTTRPAARFNSRSAQSLLPAILATLLGACGQPFVHEEEPLRALRVVRIGDTSAISSRSFPGRAAASQEVDLSFRVGGPLIALPVKIGDRVQTGESVARIDPNDYQVRERSVQSELERSQAELTLAIREYQRAEEANAKNPDLISRSEIDRRLAARDRARANVAALEASLQAARDEVAYTNLQAPFTGTVVSTYVENFETIRAEQPIVRVVDNTRVEFRINIPETLISLLPAIQNVRIRFDAYPDAEITAEVYEVGSEASEVTRTYPVTLVMDQPPDFEILPGMAGRAMGEAATPVADRSNVPVVPVTAVFAPQAGGASHVWSVDDSGRVSLRQVETGRLVSGGVEVTSGLESGQLIAAAGVHFLTEGQTVKPIFD